MKVEEDGEGDAGKKGDKHGKAKKADAAKARDQLYKNRSSRKIDSRRLFAREYDFPKTFSLTENQFSGKAYLNTIASSSAKGKSGGGGGGGKTSKGEGFFTFTGSFNQF